MFLHNKGISITLYFDSLLIALRRDVKICESEECEQESDKSD